MLIKWPSLMLRYFSDWRKYRKLENTNKCDVVDSYPCIYDRTSTTGLDKAYFYQGLWAMKIIRNSAATKHVDIGSDNMWVGWLTTHLQVEFIDIRPMIVEAEGLENKFGSILDLPFEDDSVQSLSSLHVIEHIGLGRYGDPLDPLGSEKALGELSRVLAPEGWLYLSLPIGKERVCFNAHRIHDPIWPISTLADLKLEEFSVVNDNGEYVNNVDPEQYRDSYYACGLYLFRK